MCPIQFQSHSFGPSQLHILMQSWKAIVARASGRFFEVCR